MFRTVPPSSSRVFFFTVHTAVVYVMQVCWQLASRIRKELSSLIIIIKLLSSVITGTEITAFCQKNGIHFERTHKRFWYCAGGTFVNHWPSAPWDLRKVVYTTDYSWQTIKPFVPVQRLQTSYATCPLYFSSHLVLCLQQSHLPHCHVSDNRFVATSALPFVLPGVLYNTR